MASDHCPINLEIAAWSGVGYGLANPQLPYEPKKISAPAVAQA
jgi:hypothetical protein